MRKRPERCLMQGGEQSYCGEFFTVENAEIFSRPESPPPVMIAAANVASAELAGTIGDGLISTISNDLIVRKFRTSDDSAEKPCFGQMTVCVGPKLKRRPRASPKNFGRWA